MGTTEFADDRNVLCLLKGGWDLSLRKHGDLILVRAKRGNRSQSCSGKTVDRACAGIRNRLQYKLRKDREAAQQIAADVRRKLEAASR